jgi:hypothetical protein
VNPPELGQVAREIEKVPHGRYIVIPTSDETRGHGTHSQAAVWKQYLVELLRSTSGSECLSLRALLIEAPGARLRYLRPRAALRR